MKCQVYLPENIMRHQATANCPEVVARLQSVLNALQADDLINLPRKVVSSSAAATYEQIRAVHDSEYLKSLDQPVKHGEFVFLDGDTALTHDSFAAAKSAAWAACDAVDNLMRDGINGFCCFRPPGHHATPNAAMGFCLLNHVAIAAHHARATWGITRVAVLDPDVHHGNGTQDIAWSDADFFFASSHQSPLYPGTGAESERGKHGNIHNAPLAAGTSAEDFLAVWRDRLLPAMIEFNPEIVLVSAGFDAHTDDPLGSLKMNEASYHDWGEMMVSAVMKTRSPGVVSVLEGGYNLKALGPSVAAHVRALSKLPHA